MKELICPDCGRPVHAHAPGGLCPSCLLGLAEQASNAAPRSSGAQADPLIGELDESEAAAGRIGRYRLLEIIGEGGFGTVWMAAQIEPVRRKVALKIIKLGMDTKLVVSRFDAERQALARMDHPHIARVFDAGATEVGRPYFVMELVRGLPITEFCDARQLNTRERIGLFIPVCEAVQHAHQKGVIHRDLKPSNILVTEQEGRATPKIIDFGVAKAIEEPLTDKTLFTRFHQFLGTPAYMSPEQAGLGGLDVDTRSDIYSLGVLLYELLTERTPFDPRELAREGHERMLEAIREQEPPRPSTRLSTLTREDLAAVARRRREEPERLHKLVRGDLDWIVLKALEKDRTRRYEAANGLAADLRRYLDDEPVAARPPSSLYRIRKLARRHKLAFASVAAVATALVGGLITTTWQAGRAERHLEEARLRAYVSGVNVAHQALAENNLARTLDLLDQHRPKGREKDLRGFEWRYLWQLCQSDCLTNFHDAGADAIEFSPDGRWLAYGGRDQVIIRDAASLEEVAAVPATAQSLSFSPDGRLLAAADWGSASVWDTTSWQRLKQLPEAGGAVLFSPDGAWLVTGQVRSNRIVLWERGTWRPLADCPNTPEVDNHMRHALAFSPDGKILTTPWIEFNGDGASELVLRELPSLAPVGRVVARQKPLACATFDRETGHLMTGTWDGRLLVWNLEDVAPRLLHEFREHSSHLFRIAVAAGGKVIATAGEDQSVNLWERGTYRHLARLRGDTNQLDALAVSPDGRTVGAGSIRGGVTRLWRTDLTNRTDLVEAGSLVAGFTGDSRTLVLGPRNGDCRWYLAGEAVRTVAVATNLDLPGDGLSKPFDVSRDRPLGALGCMGGRLELWDLDVWKHWLCAILQSDAPATSMFSGNTRSIPRRALNQPAERVTRRRGRPRPLGRCRLSIRGLRSINGAHLTPSAGHCSARLPGCRQLWKWSGATVTVVSSLAGWRAGFRLNA